MAATISGNVTLKYTDSAAFTADLSSIQAKVDNITVSNVTSDSNLLTISVSLSNYSG